MSFDYSTLITDRARSDSDTLKTLLGKPMAEWTAEERTAFNSAMLKGSYDYTDLNRVDACMEDLVARLTQVGCLVPGYQRVKIERAVTPSSRLPEGYAEVQYIQSTGAQWIDTGVKPDQTYALKIKFQTEQSSSGGIAVSDANWQSNGFGIWCNAAAFGNGTMQTTEWHGTTPIEIELSQQGLFVNGNLTWTPDAATFTVPANMTLFALNRNGSIAEKLTGKIYFAQLLKAGKLVRDFIPCVDPTGTVGLYDLVGGKFYGNSGTGVFLAGPPKATLPEGYTQVEYIQSSGTQYINTGFRPKNTTKVMMDFQVTAQPKSHQIIFGERTSYSGADQFVLGYTGHKSPAVWRSDFGSSQVSFPSTVLWSTRMTAVRNGPDCTLNGVAVKNNSAVFSATHNLFLLANNDNETVAGNISAKLYFCQISDGEKMARFFIPCKNAGAVGLYDLIGQKFYGNAGTGSFTAGPAVTWDALPEEPTETLDPYTWYESDVPTVSLLARYRDNVAAVRGVLRLPEGTPEVPATLRKLTQTEANSIEAVLLAVDLILNHIPAAVRHCGVTVCGGKGVRA